MIALQKNTCQSVGLELLTDFIQNERLSHSNFEQLDEFLAITAYEFQKGKVTRETLSKTSKAFGMAFLKNTLLGRGYLKPNGYPGDYRFLDGVYTNHITKNEKYKIWDEYIQQHAAPVAVRNRKAYFKHLVKNKAKKTSQCNILNVISGSGRELAELYATGSKNVYTTCVEIDKEAIAFSKALNKGYLENITYINSNIFRYQTDQSFDLIWAAGLFDYLNDNAFVRLLKHFAQWQKEDGEIIIGNFNGTHNPSRAYMEILGDWYLIHRTEAQLLQLTKKAGFEEDQIHVSRMPDNVILYLHIQNTKK